MAWLAVDKNETEWIYKRIPTRSVKTDECWYSTEQNIKIPSGSIEKLTGKQLTWKDEPIELK